MTIVALASSSGSPGVTSTAYGFAVAAGRLVKRTPLLVEADPSGGAMALRFGLDGERSLAAFSGVAARGVESGTLATFTSDVNGVACLVAPSDPLLAEWALRRSASMLAQDLIADHQLAVVDLGRISAESPAMPLAVAARMVLLLTRPTAEDAQSMLFGVRALKQAGCRVGLVCLGDKPFHPQELAHLAGVPLVAVLPDDPSVAVALRGGSHSPRRFRRSSLWKSIEAMPKVLLADGRGNGSAQPNGAPVRSGSPMPPPGPNGAPMPPPGPNRAPAPTGAPYAAPAPTGVPQTRQPPPPRHPHRSAGPPPGARDAQMQRPSNGQVNGQVNGQLNGPSSSPFNGQVKAGSA